MNLSVTVVVFTPRTHGAHLSATGLIKKPIAKPTFVVAYSAGKTSVKLIFLGHERTINIIKLYSTLAIIMQESKMQNTDHISLRHSNL